MATLLTGATGFLGGQLCAELLKEEDTPVYCLVRAPDRTTAARRLHARLSAADATEESIRRAVPVVGDITRSDLGLAPGTRDELASSVTDIVHCAASINMSAPYDQLVRPNVEGTLLLLDLAERRAGLGGDPVHFHFVSSVGVFLHARRTGLSEVDEAVTPDPPMADSWGYALSKITAEAELRAAAAQGLPLTVHRPGLITAHSRTGRTMVEADTLAVLAQAVVVLGVAPDTTSWFPLDTVDTIARGMAALRSRENTGHTYHHVRPTPVPFSHIFDALRTLGYRLPTVSTDLWWRHVAARADDPGVSRLAILTDVAKPALTNGHTPDIRSDRTWDVLTRTGLNPPPLDHDHFCRFIAHLIAEGTLPPPVGA
ncbi:SDR family oxidoreductase [Actinosynnema sp. NPDC050436]|uniref:SDR family oxidoreductase n=1 Tax=Actinosynnema sp. NPDC050436 TaxID=3155659 RepID=UPI0033D82E49